MVQHTCIIKECRHEDTTDEIDFFNLPLVKSRAKIWLLNCKREDLSVYIGNYQFLGRHVVCSHHFSKKQYSRSGSFIKPRLLPEAIPDINLPRDLGGSKAKAPRPSFVAASATTTDGLATTTAPSTQSNNEKTTIKTTDASTTGIPATTALKKVPRVEVRLQLPPGVSARDFASSPIIRNITSRLPQLISSDDTTKTIKLKLKTAAGPSVAVSATISATCATTDPPNSTKPATSTATATAGGSASSSKVAGGTVGGFKVEVMTITEAMAAAAAAGKKARAEVKATMKEKIKTKPGPVSYQKKVAIKVKRMTVAKAEQEEDDEEEHEEEGRAKKRRKMNDAEDIDDPGDESEDDPEPEEDEATDEPGDGPADGPTDGPTDGQQPITLATRQAYRPRDPRSGLDDYPITRGTSEARLQHLQHYRSALLRKIHVQKRFLLKRGNELYRYRLKLKEVRNARHEMSMRDCIRVLRGNMPQHALELLYTQLAAVEDDGAELICTPTVIETALLFSVAGKKAYKAMGQTLKLPPYSDIIKWKKIIRSNPPYYKKYFPNLRAKFFKKNKEKNEISSEGGIVNNEGGMHMNGDDMVNNPKKERSLEGSATLPTEEIEELYNKMLSDQVKFNQLFEDPDHLEELNDELTREVEEVESDEERTHLEDFDDEMEDDGEDAQVFIEKLKRIERADLHDENNDQTDQIHQRKRRGVRGEKRNTGIRSVSSNDETEASFKTLNVPNLSSVVNTSLSNGNATKAGTTSSGDVNTALVICDNLDAGRLSVEGSGLSMISQDPELPNIAAPAAIFVTEASTISDETQAAEKITYVPAPHAKLTYVGTVQPLGTVGTVVPVGTVGPAVGSVGPMPQGKLTYVGPVEPTTHQGKLTYIGPVEPSPHGKLTYVRPMEPDAHDKLTYAGPVEPVPQGKLTYVGPVEPVVAAMVEDDDAIGKPGPSMPQLF